MVMELKGNELYNLKVPAGKYTYFFDVRKSESGNYIVITQTQRQGKKFLHERIMVYDDQLDNFVKGLEEVKKFIRGKQIKYS